MSYIIGPVQPGETTYRFQRWSVRDPGSLSTAAAYTLTRWGARRLARRWLRQQAGSRERREVVRL